MKTYFVEDVLEELGIKWIWGLESIWRRGRVWKKGPVVFSYLMLQENRPLHLNLKVEESVLICYHSLSSSTEEQRDSIALLR